MGASAQFRKAGITDVRTQPIDAGSRSRRCGCRCRGRCGCSAILLLAPGSSDVILESALPVGPSDIPGGTLTAPLVYVGAASPAVLQHIDVKGKIAVQLIVPQGHMLFERGAVDSRAEELVKRGAVGVFNLVRLPGNELSRDFSDCGNPCFNIGGRDGWFLEAVLDRAAQAGVQDKLRVRIELQTQTFRGLKAINGVAVIPGSSERGDRPQRARRRLVRRRRRQRRRPRRAGRARASFREAAATSRSARWCSWRAPGITRPASTVRAVSWPPIPRSRRTR